MLTKKKTDYAFLFFITVYGFILRLIYLDYNPMWIDETISSLASKGIVEYGYPLLDSGATYFRAYIFHYLQAFFMLIFGVNDFGSRFISVIFGILTIILAYYYGRENKFVRYGFPMLICLFSYEIYYSKQARMYQMFQFFYFLTFYLFYKFLKKDYVISKKWTLIFIGLSLFVTINTQTMGYFLILFFPLIYTLNKKRYKIKYYLFVLIGLIIVLFLSKNLITSNIYTIINYLTLYSSFFTYYLPFTVLFFIGVIYSFYKKETFNIYLLFISVIPLVSILFLQIYAFRYIYFFVFTYLYFIAYGVSKIRYNYIILAVMIIAVSGNLFFLIPNNKLNENLSEPYADYRGLNFDNETIVATWPAGPTWYGIKVNYWLHHSISGLSTDNWMIYNNTEAHSGAKIIYELTQIESEFILLVDDNSYGKLNLKNREYISSCLLLDKREYLKIYKCN